ncbi:hypothetical protein AB0Q95_45815 [Streptomyces sp. NPDC059900]|uniref:hypothetical protein n=1 Tax=Streptomyces sp. NPDC059900 TaxID=3155816 RepID=UPI003419338D
MSTEQHDADGYGQELAAISHHQHEATSARFTVFQALAAAGIGHEQADDIVAKLEAGAVAGAHTWISESSPLAGSAHIPGHCGRSHHLRPVHDLPLAAARCAGKRPGREISRLPINAVSLLPSKAGELGSHPAAQQAPCPRACDPPPPTSWSRIADDTAPATAHPA